MEYKYKHSIIGGTFDHLHEGHMYFLDAAFQESEYVTIGLTTDSMVEQKKLHNAIEDLKTRKDNLIQYLKDKKYETRSKIIPIEDIYGNSLTEKNLDAIFVTSLVLENANIINEKRVGLGLPPLTIEHVPVLKTSSGDVVSSTHVREGRMDRHGESFLDIFSKSGYLKMPQDLRDSLGEPFGEVVLDLRSIDFKKATLIIAVGDIVVSALCKEGITPDISIFDKKTKRQGITDTKVLDNLPKPTHLYINPQGAINCSIAIEISRLIKQHLESGEKFAIKIDGEEDLLSLPAIILSPLKSVVVYGIRDMGAVVVSITPQMKSRVMKLLEKFHPERVGNEY